MLRRSWFRCATSVLGSAEGLLLRPVSEREARVGLASSVAAARDARDAREAAETADGKAASSVASDNAGVPTATTAASLPSTASDAASSVARSEADGETERKEASRRDTHTAVLNLNHLRRFVSWFPSDVLEQRLRDQFAAVPVTVEDMVNDFTLLHAVVRAMSGLRVEPTARVLLATVEAIQQSLPTMSGLKMARLLEAIGTERLRDSPVSLILAPHVVRAAAAMPVGELVRTLASLAYTSVSRDGSPGSSSGRGPNSSDANSGGAMVTQTEGPLAEVTGLLMRRVNELTAEEVVALVRSMGPQLPAGHDLWGVLVRRVSDTIGEFRPIQLRQLIVAFRKKGMPTALLLGELSERPSGDVGAAPSPGGTTPSSGASGDAAGDGQQNRSRGGDASPAERPRSWQRGNYAPIEASSIDETEVLALLEQFQLAGSTGDSMEVAYLRRCEAMIQRASVPQLSTMMRRLLIRNVRNTEFQHLIMRRVVALSSEWSSRPSDIAVLLGLFGAMNASAPPECPEVFALMVQSLAAPGQLDRVDSAAVARLLPSLVGFRRGVPLQFSAKTPEIIWKDGHLIDKDDELVVAVLNRLAKSVVEISALPVRAFLRILNNAAFLIGSTGPLGAAALRAVEANVNGLITRLPAMRPDDLCVVCDIGTPCPPALARQFLQPALDTLATHPEWVTELNSDKVGSILASMGRTRARHDVICEQFAALAAGKFLNIYPDVLANAMVTLAQLGFRSAEVYETAALRVLSSKPPVASRVVCVLHALALCDMGRSRYTADCLPRLRVMVGSLAARDLSVGLFALARVGIDASKSGDLLAAFLSRAAAVVADFKVAELASVLASVKGLRCVSHAVFLEAVARRLRGGGTASATEDSDAAAHVVQAIAALHALQPAAITQSHVSRVAAIGAGHAGNGDTLTAGLPATAVTTALVFLAKVTAPAPTARGIGGGGATSTARAPTSVRDLALPLNAALATVEPLQLSDVDALGVAALVERAQQPAVVAAMNAAAATHAAVAIAKLGRKISSTSPLVARLRHLNVAPALVTNVAAASAPASSFAPIVGGAQGLDQSLRAQLREAHLGSLIEEPSSGVGSSSSFSSSSSSTSTAGNEDGSSSRGRMLRLQPINAPVLQASVAPPAPARAPAKGRSPSAPKASDGAGAAEKKPPTAAASASSSPPKDAKWAAEEEPGAKAKRTTVVSPPPPPPSVPQRQSKKAASANAVVDENEDEADGDDEPRAATRRRASAKLGVVAAADTSEVARAPRAKNPRETASNSASAAERAAEADWIEDLAKKATSKNAAAKKSAKTSPCTKGEAAADKTGPWV